MKVNPQELITGVQEKNRLLSLKNDEYAILIEERASSERAYNIAVAEKTIALKIEGNSIGLIDKLVRGDKTIAQLKYQLDVAEGVEKACLQAIKNLRSAIDTYRSLLSWLKAEMTGQ